MYSLEEISLSPDAWDAAIRGYKSKALFHESAWLAHLERTQNGQRLLVAIRDGNDDVGYFCGVVIRKGPFRVLGSPLRGWWTPVMGPIVNECDEQALLVALGNFCRTKGIDYIELCSHVFKDESMEAAGYLPENDITYLLRISSPDEMWRRMEKNARNPIRQAEKKGVSVEAASDISVMGEYFAQLQAVFARKSLTPPHRREMVYDLWESLYPLGKLVVLRAMHEGRYIATHIGAFDERVLYGLGWASWPEAYPLRPNDLIQWKVMTFAAEKGLLLYDMCGGGEFKAKFGAEVVPRVRWHKGLTLSARIGRDLYKAFWFGRRELLQRLRRWHSETKLATEPVGHEG